MRSLTGQFLVATPSLEDPNFHHAVILILRHDDQGALGVVVNRPIDVTVRQACEQVLEQTCDVDGVPLPVLRERVRVRVLHRTHVNF